MSGVRSLGAIDCCEQSFHVAPLRPSQAQLPAAAEFVERAGLLIPYYGPFDGIGKDAADTESMPNGIGATSGYFSNNLREISAREPICIQNLRYDL